MRQIQLAFLPVGDENWRVLTVTNAPPRTPGRILVVRGAGVLAREVEAVGRTEAQARATAISSLSQDLAAAPDASTCALGPAVSGRRLAFVAAQADIAGWVSAAAEHGFVPDAIVPDFALLPEPAEGEASVARHGDWLARTHNGGFACQEDFLSLLLGDRRAVEHDFEPAVIATVRSGALARLPTFVPNTRSATAGPGVGKTLLRAGLVAAAALAIAAAIPWIDTLRLDAATNDLRAETVAVARAALPHARRIVNPLAQLHEAMLPQARGKSSLLMAASVFEGLAKSPGVDIARIELDAEGAVHASLSMPNATLMQPLRDHLAASRLHVVETPGASQLNNLPMTLTVTAAP